MTRFLVVPQWQGSPSARAMLLVDGASAIAGDLPRNATTVLDVPLEAGESLGTGVHRLSSLQRIRAMVATEMTSDTIVIGGDCSVTVAALDAIDRDDLALVWCDAHGDLHTDQTSPSGAFSGMALRAALGEGEPQLALSPGLPEDRVVVVGARVLEDSEEEPLTRLSRVASQTSKIRMRSPTPSYVPGLPASGSTSTSTCSTPPRSPGSPPLRRSVLRRGVGRQHPETALPRPARGRDDSRLLPPLAAGCGR